MRAVREIDGIDRDRFRRDILPSAAPAVFRGLAKDWPIVAGGDPAGFLRPLADDMPREALVAPPSAGGRFFYAEGMTGFNFAREPMTIGALLDRLVATADPPSPPSIAMQSIPADAVPSFAEAHPLALAPEGIPPRLWIGNRAVTALHHDVMSNIAVVVAGRRRFTLIPPSQAPYLYTGPLEFTPAGTPVSLVDPEHPDLDRFPRFAQAIPWMETAELEPGDAIYIPYMWWHQVRAHDTLSILANFWWTEGSPARPGMAPVDALVHALLALCDLPDEQRRAWCAMFEAKLFPSEHDHIPVERRGILGTVPADAARGIARQLGTLMVRGAGTPAR